jgi:DNA-binding GntR family transcriptional regulator
MAARKSAPSRRSKPFLPEATVPPYETLKKSILAGDLMPGHPLIEVALAEWVGVSRTPIREALQRLEQDGLVYRSDRGLMVRERSPQEILDIYETRVALEATVGRVAAERRTQHDVLILRELLQRGAAVRGDDAADLVEANEQFHRAMWRASHNESLIDLLERLNLHLARYPGTTLSWPGRWAAARRQHKQIVDAVEKRDADLAYSCALKHFTDARDIRLRLFAQDSPDS